MHKKVEQPAIGIRSAARKPLGKAFGVASIVLAGGAHAQAQSVDIPAIDVYADVNSGYQAPTNSGVTRLQTPLRDTPQTVNVIPQQVIQEQRSMSVEDTLRYVPGITFSAGEGGQQGDGPIIRGFVARGDLFRDGIRDPGWYTRDTFSSDRVEVYKGPSAFAFGRGATGGAINTVTKLPTGAQYNELIGTVTSGPGVRGEIDSSGKKDNVSMRISALGMDTDTPTRDNVFVQRWGVAPSVKWDINPATSALFSYIYQGERGPSDYGITYLPQPAYSPLTGALTNPGYYGNGLPTPPVPASRKNWYGIASGPLRDMTTTETHIGTIKLERDITNDMKVVNATRYMTNDRWALPTATRSLGDASNVPFNAGYMPFGYPVDQMTIGRERRQRETDNTFLINQTDFLSKFATGDVGHSFVAGAELSRETRDQSRLDLCDPTNIACRTSVVAPVQGSPTGGAIVQHNPNSTDSSTIAGYASDTMKWRSFDFLSSVRFDRFSTVYQDLDQAIPANRRLERTDNMWSYRFGVVYHLTSFANVYVAYGNANNPSAEQGTLSNPSQAALAPENTTTLEGGYKIDALGNRLSLTGALFQIQKRNLRITDPTNSTVSVLDGIARVQGVELGAAGKITDKWQLIGGYSYLQSEITDTSDLSISGRHLPNTPEQNFALWTTYNVAPKWTIGGGATYQSRGWANTGNTAYVPSFWKFDVMASYRLDDRSSLQLNLYNITNEMYYAQYYGNNVVPASGRWASLTYRIRW
jgi:catecholate siderophore receptor